MTPERLLVALMFGDAGFAILVWCAWDLVYRGQLIDPKALWDASSPDCGATLRVLGDFVALAILGTAAGLFLHFFVREVPEGDRSSPIAPPRRRAGLGGLLLMALSFAVPITVLDAIMNPPVTTWTFGPGVIYALVLFGGVLNEWRKQRKSRPDV